MTGSLDRGPSLVAATFVLFWVTLLAHEAAHAAAAALAVGSMPFTAEQFDALAAPQRLSANLAGPIATILIVGVCAMGARIVRSPAAMLLTATALTTASRVVLIMPATLLRFGYNDETTISSVVAVSPRVLWSVEFLVIGMCCCGATSSSRPRLQARQDGFRR